MNAQMNDELKGMWKQVVVAYMWYYPSICLQEQKPVRLADALVKV
jgi:hypothetical protein